MSNPKVNEREMPITKEKMLKFLRDVEYLTQRYARNTSEDDTMFNAIRLAIEERGRLRKGIKKWLWRLLAVNAEGHCDGDTQIFLDELEIYWHDIVGDNLKLDGEEGE